MDIPRWTALSLRPATRLPLSPPSLRITIALRPFRLARAPLATRKPRHREGFLPLAAAPSIHAGQRKMERTGGAGHGFQLQDRWCRTAPALRGPLLRPSMVLEEDSLASDSSPTKVSGSRWYPPSSAKLNGHIGGRERNRGRHFLAVLLEDKVVFGQAFLGLAVL